MTTFNFAAGDMLADSRTIVAIRGRWVDLSDGATLPRAGVVAIGAAPSLGSVTIIDFKPYLDKYVRTRSADGRRRLDSGDVVAVALRGLELEEVYEYVSDVIDVPALELRAKYAHLNIGQQRMNLGNRLRAYNKRAANGEA